MNHTFLFEPGVWAGAGTFWTADAHALTAEARTQVTHREECWLLAGTLRVLASPPVEFVNHYSIEPPQKELAAMKWSAETSATGKLHGTFSVVGPAILSLYHSEGSAQYQGTEHLMQINPHHYEACGVLLLDGRRLSSWRVALTRES
jgi:hypothetical protein